VRTAANLTTKQLAQRVGVSDVTITYIETGQTNPARRTLILLAQALETDFGDPSLREHVPKHQREVRILGRVAAGKPIERIEPDRALTVGPDIIKRVEKVVAFEVEGESMLEDYILDSDILLCREVEPTRNAIAVVEFDDDTATVKRWRPKGQSVTLGADTYSIKRIRRTFEVLGLIRRMK
jgi:SOS-response transcriptional repressor LexA